MCESFFESRTSARQGGEVRCNLVRAACEAWCAECGIEPVSLTRLGTIAKGQLGIGHVERSKRGFYLGIALKEAPQLRVVAS
jgi:hypothetical protein